MTPHETVQADLDRFLTVLPDRIRQWLETHAQLEELKEVVIDLGRPVDARFVHSREIKHGQPALNADIVYVN